MRAECEVCGTSEMCTVCMKRKAGREQKRRSRARLRKQRIDHTQPTQAKVPKEILDEVLRADDED